MARRNAWQVVVEALRAEGVKRVYGIPGNPRHLYDALYDAPEIQPVLVRHEAAGVFMAMAEARLTGQPGVVFTSPGPGVANLVAGMLEAFSACAPLILFAPGTPASISGMGAFQEADQLSMLKPITKWAVRVEKPELVSWAVRRAFAVASAGKPGPVYVEIPGDVALEPAEMPAYRRSVRPAPPAADHAAVEKAVDLLLSAERPVLMLGGGAVLSGAGDEARALAELQGLPILTSLSGRGSVAESHPLAVGMTGLYFNELSYRFYSEADLMLSVGCRHEEFESERWIHLRPEAKFMQIDIDAFEIGRNFVPDLAIVADARSALAAIAQALRGRTQDKNAIVARSTMIAQARREYEAKIDEECLTEATPIRTKRVVREINRVFGHDTVLVCENGGQDLWSYYYPYYRVLDDGDCVVPAEQTCMGMGVVGAIGARLARPDKKVVCTTGDATFQMYAQDLPTAVQYEAPVTWVVLNSYGLGWPKLTERALGERYIAVDFEAQPDFPMLARANGCHGERVTEPSGIRPALERALEANQRGVPAVVEFVVEPWEFSWGFKEYHRRSRDLPSDLL